MTKKYLLKFGGRALGKPVLADCVLKTKARINILKADAEGNMLVKIPKSSEEKVLRFLRDEGVDVTEQKNVVEYDRERCIDCGLCTSLCPTGAFSLDAESTLVYNEDKCVLCGLCIDACPRRALSKPKF